jgi:hypothetical protein
VFDNSTKAVKGATPEKNTNKTETIKSDVRREKCMITNSE